MRSKIQTLAFVLMILLGIFLLTKSWLPHGTYIAGHDSGLAINTEDFLKTRLYSWSVQNFGQDNSPHFGSIIIHSIDFITSKLTGVSYAGNHLNLFFWISAIFIAAFYFADSLKEYLGEYFPFLFSVFITLNFFILQSIFILERAKYSIFIAGLLILTFLFKLDKKKIRYRKAFLYSVLTLLFFNCGSWFGIPLYGSLFILMIAFVMFVTTNCIANKSYKKLFKFTFFLVFLGVGFIVVNAYSILPYLSTFINSDASRLVDPTVVSQNKSWLISISQASSYLNFFRLQGVPDWYSGANIVNLQHSYAQTYLTNPFLIVISYMFPILSISSFLFVKNKNQRNLVYFFTLTTVLGIFFMAGSNGPLGFLYEIFYSEIPGFAIFRSPYYKFASAFLIGYIGLISFTISSFIEKFGKKYKLLLCLLVIGGWISYHYVIFDSQKIFSWQTNLSTRVSFPEGVTGFYDTKDNLDIGDSRILLLPPINQYWMNDAYSWGYWSLSNLPSLLVPGHPFLVNDGLLVESQGMWLNNLYKSIKDSNNENFDELSVRLGISQILLREDVLQSLEWSSVENPDNYKRSLKNLDSVKVKESFSGWTLYEVITKPKSKIFNTDDIAYVSKESVSLTNIFLDKDIHFGQIEVDEYIGHFTVARCLSCEIELKVPQDSLPEVTLLPNSKFYFLKELRDKKQLNIVSGYSKAFTYLGIALRQSSEAVAMSRFDSEDNNVVSVLKKVNSNLSLFYDYIQKNSDKEKDYSTYSRLLDFLSPIEINLKNQIARGEFSKKSDDYREEYYDVLWLIRMIDNNYSYIKNNIDNYRVRKYYNLFFERTGLYKLHVEKKDLPQTLAGEKILPEYLEYIDGNQYKRLEPGDAVESIYFELNMSKPGEIETIMVFGDLPNLYADKGGQEISLPHGDNGCMVGKINSYNKNSNYRINFAILDRTQRLRLYIKSGNANTITGQGFLKGDIEREIDAVNSMGRYTYLYKPYGATDPTLYVCGSSGEIPNISKLEVYEIVSPSIVVEKSVVVSNETSNLDIDYKRINSTKYEFSLDKDHKNILIFNEAFSDLWKLKKDNVGLEDVKHFMVDGYANAWIIPEGLSGNFTIEHLPQTYFYIGAGVTATFLMFLVGYSVLLSIKNKDG